MFLRGPSRRERREFPTRTDPNAFVIPYVSERYIIIYDSNMSVFFMTDRGVRLLSKTFWTFEIPFATPLIGTAGVVSSNVTSTAQASDRCEPQTPELE
jgi:hypothetical protein